MKRALLVGSFLEIMACSGPPQALPTVPKMQPAADQGEAKQEETFVLTVLGTNDLHGHVEALPLLAGYVEALRARRATSGAEHGAVLLLDGGDIFQGTLESNQDEGLPVVQIYNALGYDAAAMGNHEFDYGPLGPKGTPERSEDDPLGALARNVESATFPFLTANLKDRTTATFPLAKVRTRVVKDVSWGKVPLRVGIIGGSTKDTLHTTLAANVRALTVSPIGAAARAEVRALRQAGADLVLMTMHAGGKCAHPEGRAADADGCDRKEEVDEVIRDLGDAHVDGIVAGHTHAAVASVFEGVPVIESHSYGRAFGRIDYVLKRDARNVTSIVQRKVFAPRLLCAKYEESPATCVPPPYEGETITRTRNPQIVDVAVRAIEKAKERKSQLLGVTLSDVFRRNHDDESVLGNLFADLLLSHYKKNLVQAGVKVTPVSLMNGGGLRQNLPSGPLAYGALFEASPFDNRLSLARTTAGTFARILLNNVRRKGGFLSIAGVTAKVLKVGSKRELELYDEKGRMLKDEDPMLLVASDFLLMGGDGFWAKEVPNEPIVETTTLVRDVFESELRSLAKDQATLSPEQYLDRKRPRVTFAE